MQRQNPNDYSNNPYAEGGQSARPPRAQWFCHQCQLDIPDNDLLRVPDPTCPRCRSDFVEKLEDSVDDPHEFDNPHDVDNGMPAGAFFMPGNGDARPGSQMPGPFGQLMQQLFNGMQASMHQQQQQSRDTSNNSNTDTPQPVNPAQAAAQAAERRAGQSTSAVPGAYPEPPSEAVPSGSSSSTFRAGPATFVWSTSSNSGPPRSTRRVEDEPRAFQTLSDSDNNENVPIRNLASFLQDAFAPSAATQQAQGNSPSGSQTSSLREGQDQRGPSHSLGEDPLSAMLSTLASSFGVPIGGGHAGGDNQPRQMGGGFQGRVMFGGPGGTVFTYTTGQPGTGGEGQQGMPFPFSMMMPGGGGGGGGAPGQMGDYIFSQGAMDNFITEMLNQANGRYGPQPAPAEVIRDLPRFKMTDELLSSATIQDCAVCKDDFQKDEEALKLPCNHLFHPDCITPWLERSGTCPVCRFALVEQPETAQAPGTSGVQGGRQAPQRQNSTPISPSLPNSPPIEGGSRMPSSGSVGDFFSNLFGRSAVNRAAEQSQPASGASNATTSANRPDDRGRDTNETQPDLDLDLD